MVALFCVETPRPEAAPGVDSDEVAWEIEKVCMRSKGSLYSVMRKEGCRKRWQKFANGFGPRRSRFVVFYFGCRL